MSGDDFGALAALWSSAPVEEDIATVDRLAARTPRLARRELVGELAAAGGIALAILLVVVVRFSLGTLAIGAMLLALLGWSAWQRHHLGDRALLVERGDRAAFLRSSVAAKRSELKRSALGLAMIVPAAFVTVLLQFVVQDGSGGVWAFLAAPLATGKGVVVSLVLILAVALFGTTHVRLGRELARLQALAFEYEDEERRDRIAGA